MREVLNEQKNPNRVRTIYLTNIIVLCLITLGAIAFAAVMLVRAHRLTIENKQLSDQVAELEVEEEETFTGEEVQEQLAAARETAAKLQKQAILMQIQSSLESGSSTTAILRSLFEDRIVVQSGGRYYIYPIQESALRNSFVDGDFSFDEAGTLVYSGSSRNISLRKGMDISFDNGEIDWTVVQDEEVGFAMIRIAAAEDDGTLTEDEQFETNLSGAIGAEVDAGVTFRMAALDVEEAKAQAQEVIDLLEPHRSQITMPVAVSLPAIGAGERLSGLSRIAWTNNVNAFCSAIAEAGYKPVIYGNLAVFTMQLDISRLENWDKWLANYDSRLYFPYDLSMWQYSANGQVGGIDGDVNMDVVIVRD